MTVATTIEMIGLINVDGDKLVLNAFLKIKLAMSSIGHMIINKHKAFSIVILFFNFSIFNFLF